MKKLLFILTITLSLFSISNIKAQTGIEWGSCFGVPNNSPDMRNACKTADGGYLLVGVAEDSAMWPNLLLGFSDFGVIKVDSVGNLIWKKTYGGNDLDNAYCVIKGIRPNRYYIAGVSRSEGSTNYHSPSTNGDAWLIAIDSAGNLLWNMCYGGYDGEIFNSLVQLGDSNIIYGIGSTGSNNGGDVTGAYIDGNPEGWICKINTNNGMLIKAKVLGGTGDEDLVHSAKLNNTQFLVQGWTHSRDHDVWTHYGNGQTSSNGWLLNIDTSLNIVWQKTIGTSGRSDIINDVLKTKDSGFAVFGSTVNRPGDTSSFTFYVDTLPNGNRKREAFIIKYDSLGNELWQQHYGAPIDAIQVEGRFVQMQDGDFIFTTNISKWNGFAMWPYNRGSVFFKTDSLGNLLSTSRYGASNGNGPLGVKSLLVNNNNKLVVVSRRSAACPSNYSSGGWSIFQIGHQLSIDNYSKTEPLVKVYPNPSNGIINIDFENTDGIKRISIYNTLGQMIESTAVNTSLKHYSINLNGKPKGLYFIGIETAYDMLFRKVILE